MKIGGVNAFHSAKGSTYSFGFFMAIFGHLKLNPFGLGEASFSKVTTFTPKKCQKMGGTEIGNICHFDLNRFCAKNFS